MSTHFVKSKKATDFFLLMEPKRGNISYCKHVLFLILFSVCVQLQSKRLFSLERKRGSKNNTSINRQKANFFFHFSCTVQCAHTNIFYYYYYYFCALYKYTKLILHSIDIYSMENHIKFNSLSASHHMFISFSLMPKANLKKSHHFRQYLWSSSIQIQI